MLVRRFVIAAALTVAQASIASVDPAMAAAPAAPRAAGKPATDTTNRPVLDDATLRREYEDYLASAKGLRLYRVSYIRVITEAEARDLIARIRSGAPFDDLARQHSTHQESAAGGGDLGSHAGCRWAKETRAMLDTLTRGQTWSKPVKGTHGWGIYRLESVTDLEPRSFERYKSELLSGKFVPECPWVPPVTIAPAPVKAPGPVSPAATPPPAAPALLRQ